MLSHKCIYMEKNQLVVVGIIIVLVIASIFLYFIFRPHTQIDESMVESDDTEFTIDFFGDDVVDDIDQVQQDLVHVQDMDDAAVDVSVQSMHVVQDDQGAPQTGPGTWAMVIALVIGIFAASTYYMSTKKSYSA